MHLDYADVLFLSSSDKFVRLSLSSWSHINVTSKHGVESPKLKSLSSVNHVTMPESY